MPTTSTGCSSSSVTGSPRGRGARPPTSGSTRRCDRRTTSRSSPPGPTSTSSAPRSGACTAPVRTRPPPGSTRARRSTASSLAATFPPTSASPRAGEPADGIGRVEKSLRWLREPAQAVERGLDVVEDQVSERDDRVPGKDPRVERSSRRRQAADLDHALAATDESETDARLRLVEAEGGERLVLARKAVDLGRRDDGADEIADGRVDGLLRRRV